MGQAESKPSRIETKISVRQCLPVDEEKYYAEPNQDEWPKTNGNTKERIFERKPDFLAGFLFNKYAVPSIPKP